MASIYTLLLEATFIFLSPLRGCLLPGSFYIFHSAGMGDASPSPMMSPSQLP